MTPPDDLREAKRALRRQVRARLAGLPATRFHDAGVGVARALEAFLAARPGPVALFASRAAEIDTAPLDDALRALGRTRAAPRIAGDALVFKRIPADVALHALAPDALGIPTPDTAWPDVPLPECVAVVPGLAFDAHGGRIGYGKGFYDRALPSVDGDRCVAVCLDEQLVDAVPMSPLDVRLAWLCTPARGVFRTLG